MTDWVTARAECSVEHVFMLLAEVIDSDVKTIQARGDRRGNFKVSRPTPTKIIVVRTAEFSDSVVAESVVFERTIAAIDVRRGNASGSQQWFSAMPSVNDEGDCRLHVDGIQLEPWQVSRRALEQLFFS
jgi:hypothetical protein